MAGGNVQVQVVDGDDAGRLRGLSPESREESAQAPAHPRFEDTGQRPYRHGRQL